MSLVDSLVPPNKSKFEQKAIIVDFFFAAKAELVGAVASNKRVHFWETRYSQRLIFSQDLKRSVEIISYLDMGKCWAFVTEDFFIELWNVDIIDTKNHMTLVRTFKAHNQRITDIEQVRLSRLLATSSFDGLIRIWDMNTSQLITELKDPTVSSHNYKDFGSGFKSMSYTTECGGYLLTTGFNQYISVFSPDTSLSKSYVGKLEGHSGIVLVCEVFEGTPHCISVDDKFNIRVWDLRTFLTIQIIRDNIMKSNNIVTALCLLPEQDRFCIGGKRVQLYNNDATRKNMKDFSAEINPLTCSLNMYYKVFLVTTKVDMRVYDALTGKLVKVFTNLSDERMPCEITDMCIGSRERKMLVCDNGGLLRTLNVNNSCCIQKVVRAKDLESRQLKAQARDESLKQEKQDQVEKDLTSPDYSAKFRPAIFDSASKKLSHEITRVIYLDNEKLIVTVGCDSIVRVYDSMDGEDAHLLREFEGGHFGSEITTACYSTETLSLVTGALNGTLCHWNFENSKLEFMYFD